jgi:hypothetical protein
MKTFIVFASMLIAGSLTAQTPQTSGTPTKNETPVVSTPAPTTVQGGEAQPVKQAPVAAPVGTNPKIKDVKTQTQGGVSVGSTKTEPVVAAPNTGKGGDVKPVKQPPVITNPKTEPVVNAPATGSGNNGDKNHKKVKKGKKAKHAGGARHAGGAKHAGGEKHAGGDKHSGGQDSK